MKVYEYYDKLDSAIRRQCPGSPGGRKKSRHCHNFIAAGRLNLQMILEGLIHSNAECNPLHGLMVFGIIQTPESGRYPPQWGKFPDFGSVSPISLNRIFFNHVDSLTVSCI
ncbi:MAG: hypothetical protein LBU85_04160 [Treponema sp.]|nr:hypothetical protein [Treponema sp.]